MQVKGHNKRIGTQRSRKCVSKSSKRKASVSSHRISGRSRRKQPSASTPVFNYASLLAKELKPISPFFVNSRSTISQEWLQENLLSIYKCLKQIEGFKDEKVWDYQPTIDQLADHLVSKVQEYCPNKYTFVISESEEQIVLNYIRTYPELYYNAVPMEWVEIVKNTNYPLYRLITGTIYKLCCACELDCLITNYEDLIINYFNILDRVKEDNPDFDDIMADLSAYKKDGIISRCRTDMQNFDASIDTQELINRINNFKPTSTRNRQIKKWLIQATDFILNPVPLSRYTLDFEELHRDGDPIKPSDSLNFCWSFYSHVAGEAEDWRNDIYGNCGIIEPCEIITYTEKKHIPAMPIERLNKLNDFFSFGRRIYEVYFDKRIKKKYESRGHREI